MTSFLQGVIPLPLFGQARPSAHASALGTRCCEQTPHPLTVKASLQTARFPGHSIPSYVHVSRPLAIASDTVKRTLSASAKFTTQSILRCKLICPPIPLPVPLALGIVSVMYQGCFCASSSATNRNTQECRAGYCSMPSSETVPHFQTGKGTTCHPLETSMGVGTEN